MKSERGAVSVQAIFMMLVLVTLGTFAITSARVNYTFSVKASDWNRMYYALEDKAERYAMDVDAVLKASGAAGGAYIDSARSGLLELSVAYPEQNVVYDEGGLYAKMNFTSDENEDANLRVSLKINENRSDPRRYTVAEWTQWQTASEEYEELILWDDFFD